MFATTMKPGLKLKTEIRDPLSVAGCITVGAVCLLGVHGLLRPQYRGISSAMAMMLIGLSIVFGVCHLFWHIFRRIFRRSLRGPSAPPPPESGPLPPDAPIPSPLRPAPTRGLTESAQLDSDGLNGQVAVNATADRELLKEP